MTFSQTARRVGIASSIATAALICAYAGTLAIGLSSLQSADDPIGDPMFTILEALILVLVPALVAQMVALHLWAAPQSRAFTLVAVIFMSLLGVVTSSVHFLVLTLSRTAAFADQPWAPLFLSFTWPSVAYGLDILAWDVFFPLAMFFAAPAVVGGRLADWIRRAMYASGMLALAGLSGVIAGDMQLRNIGILGYVGVFLIVAMMLARLFHQTEPTDARQAHSVSTKTLQAIADAFNAHDLDAIMEFFADDCTFDMPRGPDPWGRRLTGKAAVREGFATRFKGLPDVHYGDDRHWVSGDRGVSEWLLTGTTPDGRRVQVRGCDLWEFRDGKVSRKDSFWKIIEEPA